MLSIIGVIGYFQSDGIISSKIKETISYITQSNEINDSIKIGAVIPLTGRFAFMGIPIKNAMDLAVSEINENGGVKGQKIEIIYGDSQGDPKTGVSETQKLINFDKTKIITTFLTGVSEAVKPVTEETKVLLLAQTVSPTITNNANYTIRMHYSFLEEGRILGGHLINIGDEPVGFIRSRDPSTSYEVEKVIIPMLQANGINRIIDETFDVGNKDFKSQVLKIKSEKVKQLCILGYGSDFPNILKELNISGLMETTKISGNLGFIELPKETPEALLKNIVFTTPPFLIASEKSDTVKSFEENYFISFQTEGISYSAYYAYDLIFIIKQVIESASSTDVETLRNIFEHKSFNLMTGTYQFDENGDAHPQVVLGEFKGAEIELFNNPIK